MTHLGSELGAFCPGPPVQIEGAPRGPFSGLCFAAKDNFDIQGHVTGAGNADWKRTHRAAAETASSVIRLIQCGATLAGKTQMNELAYGALGENQHYGTPINPRAPGRVPGGSSSGSASAVAGGLVDFALGSDSACSVRLPAALCGVFGFRPTLDRVSTRGLVPLSPSLDTVGWFARDPELLLKVGNVLLDEPRAETGPPQVALWADDAAALVDPAVLEALQAGSWRCSARWTLSPCLPRRSSGRSSTSTPGRSTQDQYPEAQLQGRTAAKPWTGSPARLASHGDLHSRRSSPLNARKARRNRPATWRRSSARSRSWGVQSPA